MKSAASLIAALVCFVLCCVKADASHQQTAGAGERQDAAQARRSSAEIAKLLSSRNPAQRREAAEEIATAVLVEHLRLVEGYRVQEKDARVRLALDWALYRLGKSQALFGVVQELDTSRAEQAVGYLKQLEGPEPLYVFLSRVNGNRQIRLLEVLAHVGDATTLERIRPFAASLDPGIADAAKFAEREIAMRLEEGTPAESKRPRQTGRKDDEDTP